MSLIILSALTIFASFFLYNVCWALLFSPLARIPGPKSFAWTKFRLAYEDYKGTRTRTIHQLHQKYGPVVRVGPNEVSFNSVTALRQIYGAGSQFGRPRSFYRMFDIYGQPHMFTFYSSLEHSARKKILSQMYAKSTILKSPVADSIQSKVLQFLNLIERDPPTAAYLDQSLHYYSLDNITSMVFGDCGGATVALDGRPPDRQVLSDIHQPTARRYSWFQIHFPGYTSWAMTCNSSLQYILNVFGLLPGDKPLAYSGLQHYALATFQQYKSNKSPASPTGSSLMTRLLNEQASRSEKGIITDMDIAAECADHLDAGLKTTSDTLMFALWALSLPSHQEYQKRLIAEVDAVNDSSNKESVTAPSVCDRLLFLDAVIRESLRLYAPIPASQPRTSSSPTTVDGYLIPAGTIVSCQAYSLHRNPEIFPKPFQFNPDRWLADDAEVAEMRRWWWPFSSGGRMCLGMHLALAEMNTLLAAIYQRYSTTMSPEFELLSPTATSRFELVYDGRFSIDERKHCTVKFEKQ
ncbi:cytochrome protein [Xylogone sp. PMI_703]|nr:cytochrome protein [Xylogone sp. PMI_703]